MKKTIGFGDIEVVKNIPDKEYFKKDISIATTTGQIIYGTYSDFRDNSYILNPHLAITFDDKGRQFSYAAPKDIKIDIGDVGPIMEQDLGGIQRIINANNLSVSNKEDNDNNSDSNYIKKIKSSIFNFTNLLQRTFPFQLKIIQKTR